MTATKRTVTTVCLIGSLILAGPYQIVLGNGQATLPAFDFTLQSDAQAWQAAHDISKLEHTPEGLRVEISGGDPYLHGPARDYPPGALLWLHLRLKSDQGGTCQVFYFSGGATEEDSVRFFVPGGEWHEAQVPMPALGQSHRLRIDPPGSGGACLLGRLWFEERVVYAPPSWPKPGVPALGTAPVTLESGNLRLSHSKDSLGGFTMSVAGRDMAVGNCRALAGYALGRETRWLDLGVSPGSVASIKREGGGLAVSLDRVDADGARWSIVQKFSPGPLGTIEVESTLAVDRDRWVLYYPVLTLLGGVGSYGTNKTQGLLPGVEYIENEPSSSEADVKGPGSWRLVPDSVKLTFPLAVIQAEGRYVGLVWAPEPDLGVVFDSPDRQFQSGGHLLGLLFPGSNGVNRQERSLLPTKPELLRANQLRRWRATLIGGVGESVVPAVHQYVKLRGLPPLPSPGFTGRDYFRLAGGGWLDSKIREDNLYRHAFWPGFGPQPASDAALWMMWLAGKVEDPALTSRLTDAAASALARVAPPNYNGAQVGHVRYPLPALIFGAVAENAAQAGNHGRAMLGRFEPDGSVVYRAPQSGLDYGITHWSREANGLTASSLVGLLEAAAFSGDRALIDAGLRHLRAMDKFRNTVPRGAQTWEIPLHTPDILASGYLVRAYTLGYELSGDSHFLDEARYWAWTGVPFVYLSPPTPRPVGLYNTIPVLGATAWAAPLWLGLPVQWCGLVYGDALYSFAKYDPAGPWKQLADGISVAGIQHTWPSSDAARQGLLPDSYQLRAQFRDGPAINPATVLAPAIKYYGEPTPYEFRPFLERGLRVHAPGRLDRVAEHKDGLAFTVRTWSPRPSWLLMNGFQSMPRVRIDGADTPLTAPHQFQSAEGRLILQIRGSPRIEVTY